MMGGVDGYSCSAKAPEGVRRLPELHRRRTTSRRPTTRPSTRRRSTRRRRASSPSPYLKHVLDGLQRGAVRLAVARHAATARTSATRSTPRVVDMLAGKGDAAEHRRRRQRRGSEGLGHAPMSIPARHRRRTLARPTVSRSGRGRRATPPPPAPPAAGAAGVGLAASARDRPPGRAGPRRLRRLRHLPGGPGRRTTASSTGRATARRPTSSACSNYVIDPHRPDFHEALRHNVFIVVLSLVIQGPIAIAARAAAQPQDARAARSSACSSSCPT